MERQWQTKWGHDKNISALQLDFKMKDRSFTQIEKHSFGYFKLGQDVGARKNSFFAL